LGTMADRELRMYRKIVHAVIDPLWKTGKMKRAQVYAWLKHRFGEQIHVGESDVDRCKEIIKLVEGAGL